MCILRNLERQTILMSVVYLDFAKIFDKFDCGRIKFFCILCSNKSRKSVFYKTVFYKTVFYKSVFYKTVFYKTLFQSMEQDQVKLT